MAQNNNTQTYNLEIIPSGIIGTRNCLGVEEDHDHTHKLSTAFDVHCFPKPQKSNFDGGRTPVTEHRTAFESPRKRDPFAITLQ
ncbi:hypothetical protein F2Q68_00031301 [Brassica cretica]|uniref:Uncharacterized protein n=1 Tax=Brassica cretica TaxID=69181 RepID=A0A8S9G7A2_BRACR|nr:hypothetical protein F2Q68_00031301 [Brassica cretica]